MAASLVAAFAPPGAAECSDAGVCRLSSAAQTPEGRTAPSSRWEAALDQSYAKGDSSENLRYLTTTASIQLRPWTGAWLRVEAPWLDIDGRGGRADGIGDLLVLGSHMIASGRWGEAALQAGIRLPTGDDDARPGLPQGYQPGLGSTDVLIGISWYWQRIQAALGYQFAGGANDLTGVHLKRGDDVAATLGYVYGWRAVTPSLALVALHRFDESIVDDGSGGRVAISNSAGNQLNLRARCAWQVNEGWTIEAGLTQALLSRDSNVDGLTRSQSVHVGIQASF